MKKLLTLASCLLVALAICTGTVCNHTHDNTCGYNPTTGKGCTHVCEEGVMPTDLGPGWPI